MKKIALFWNALVVLFMVACQNHDEVLENVSVKGTPAENRLWMIKEVLPQTKTVAVTNKLWASGDTIRIKFLNGDEMLQNKVKQYAAQWLEYAEGLRFEYTDGDADVKISFDWDEKYLAWSTIGTDCRLVPQNESSMNFVYLDDPDEDFVRGEVLRAFGHLLGLGFEHQNPTSPIVFKANAASVLATNYGLDDMEVEAFLQQYQADRTNYTEYDKTSIMVVELPRTILENRSYATTFNTELSDNDIDLISSLYPKLNEPKKLEFEVLVDGLYSTRKIFCLDFQKRNVYYVLSSSFPIDYENGMVILAKMDLETGMETHIFTQYSVIINDFVVDPYENFYINMSDYTGNAIWKYDSYYWGRQALSVPDYLFEPRGNAMGIDRNGHFYATTLASNFPMAMGPLVVDTTYVFGFANDIYGTCIQKITHNLWESLEMNLVGESMLLNSYYSAKFYQMKLSDENTLTTKKVDLDVNRNNHISFVVDRDSDLVYVMIAEGCEDINHNVKNVLYKYSLDSGKVDYIGELPSEVTTADGRILDRLQYCHGVVVNENELILAGIVGAGENTCLVKVNITVAN
ncbi:MAG: hypothetical protein K2I90_03490 [Odoribacter sp.]|nr:hypothetical protein [Odoribacter sp.]